MITLTERSFTSEITIANVGLEGSIALTRAEIPGRSGWLVHGGTQHSLSLVFNYREKTQDRILYDIVGGPTMGDYAGAKLGLSVGGFLGLYHKAQVTEPWKIEVLLFSNSSGKLHFWLRDSEGYRVSLYPRDPNIYAPAGIAASRYDYLAAGNNPGEPLIFSVKVPPLP